MIRLTYSLLSRTFLLWLVVTLALGQSIKPPGFEDYRVSRVYRGSMAAPKFGNINQYSGSDVRCFGGDPNEYAKKQVNFAGHFVIGACTCGSGCHYLYMWDAVTGNVYLDFPVHSINVGPHREYKGEQYRSDSNLLIVEACLEDTCDCATRYYSWNHQQFKLILKRPVPTPADCLK